jgi:predicted 3-demethylubiquinone-9 3-methyltransferase (glyoxalase superfamily)
MIKFKLEGNKFFINDEYVIIRDNKMREALDIFCRLNNHPKADQYWSGRTDDEFRHIW